MFVKLINLTFLFLFSSHSFAAEPVGGCRVKADTLQRYGSFVSSSGCLITRINHGIREYLLVYVEKGDDRGWGFPGGKSASREHDSKIDSKTGEPKSESLYQVSQTTHFDYAEPAVCTASRESREEIGSDVIVGDLIDRSKYFTVFHCILAESSMPRGSLTPNDTHEVQGIGWYSRQQMQKKNFLRFESNLDIVKKFEGTFTVAHK